MTDWPLVLPDDDGIRPTGPPDACFYCKQHVGDVHARDCVTVHKTVRVRYVYELTVNVPHHWTAENFEFHRNESSWCSHNSLAELDKAFGGEDWDCSHFCLEDGFRAEFIADEDLTPRRGGK